MIKNFTALSMMGLLAACAPSGGEKATKPAADIAETANSAKMDHSKIVTGNGVNNYIILDGATRAGNRFTFTKTVISQPGFLVIHPFRNGQPVQTEYVGAVPLPQGLSENVDIPVSVDVSRGDMFIVMLHYDMNRDGIFDFNDGVTVPDAPVFEGHTLVALRYVAP